MRHAARALGVEINGYFFDGHWLLFAAGILLYDRVNYLQGRAAWLARGAWGAGAAYGLSERLFASDVHDRHVGEYIFVACAFALLLSAVKRWDRQIAAHWSLAAFRWSGTMSYSIYLAHFPLTVCIACLMAEAGWRSDRLVLLGTIPLCLTASLVVASIFHLVVERPFINAPQR